MLAPQIGIDPRIALCERGLVLGAETQLAFFADASDRLVIDQPRLEAMFAVAFQRPPSSRDLSAINAAATHWQWGDKALANLRLAVADLPQLRETEDVVRLKAAELLFDAGLRADDLAKFFDVSLSDEGLEKYDPNQPRVPAGSGKDSGRWTALWHRFSAWLDEEVPEYDQDTGDEVGTRSRARAILTNPLTILGGAAVLLGSEVFLPVAGGVATAAPEAGAGVAAALPEIGVAAEVATPEVGAAVATAVPEVGSAAEVAAPEVGSAVPTAVPEGGPAAEVTAPKTGAAVPTALPEGGSAAVVAPPEVDAPAIAPVAEEAQVLSTFAQRYLNTSGGRLGSTVTRQQLYDIAQDFAGLGDFEEFEGDGQGGEEYIPGSGPGTKGGTFVDFTAKSADGYTVRVQTVDTLADGVTPTKSEAAAAARIKAAYPDDRLFLIPKRMQ